MSIVVVHRLIRVVKGLKKVRRVLYTKLGFVATFFTTMWVVNALLFYYSEHVIAGREEVDLWTSLYWSIITMATIGYGDITPLKGLGWVVAGFAAVMGILAYTLTVSVIADAFLSASIRKTLGMAPLKSKDVVVIGDSDSCMEVIDELVLNGFEDKTGWLTPKQLRIEPRVDYMVGDPSDEGVLKKAGVDRAKHVILCLSDDSKALHIALLVKKVNKKASISAIVSNTKTEDLLREIGVKHTLSNKLLGRAIASAVFEPSVLLFISDVTSVRGKGDLIEVVVDDKLAGRDIESIEEYLDKDSQGYRHRVLAIVRGKEMDIAPSRDYKVVSGDRLVVLRTKAS